MQNEENGHEIPSSEKEQQFFYKDILEAVVLAVVLAIVLRLFILEPFYIPSGSMEPTLFENDRIIVSKLNYRFTEPQRGDVIVFKYPLDTSKNYVKRLIALGGETVEIQDSVIYVDGSPISEDYLPAGLRFANYGPFEVPADTYFMMGDNRNNSSDSREWGIVVEDLIIGKAVLLYWPPGRVGAVY